MSIERLNTSPPFKIDDDEDITKDNLNSIIDWLSTALKTVEVEVKSIETDVADHESRITVLE